MDLHRRRSVLVRMTESGEHLETVRIRNDPDSLADVMSRAGQSPEVVLEATYGWYWAADALAELGATVRELVRHRAKLVAMRSQCKAHVHAVLAKGGIWVPMTDLFGVEGNLLLDKVTMPAPYKARIASLRRFIEAFDAEIDLFTGLVQRRLAHDAGYTAIQQIPGIGPVLAAVFIAQIGDVHRFAGPGQLASWAGLTPRHRESDTTMHRGRITKQGSRLVRWAAIESVKILPDTSRIGAIREQVAHRRGNRNIGAVAAARKQLELVYYALRDHHVRALHRPPHAA
jgi:transposase